MRRRNASAGRYHAVCQRLHIDRSELLREALHRHLSRLRAEHDIDAWQDTLLADDEQAISQIADWGPAEDWSDWADATR